MKTFFGRLALPILLIVFFLVPFSFRGARVAVKNMKNEISEWLPKNFQESSEMAWFWQHFLGERFIIVSWPGCTGAADDPSFKLFVDKLTVEVPPSRRPSETEEGAPTEDAAMAGESSGETQTVSSPLSQRSAFGTNLERTYEFVGEKYELFSTGEHYENWGQRHEKWILGKEDRWYYITPNGDLYLWDEADAPIASFGRRLWRMAFGGEIGGQHLATLGEVDGPWYYENPRRLDAQLFKTVTTGPGVVAELTREGGVLPGDQKLAVERLSGSLYGPDGKQTCFMLTLTNAGIKNFHRAIGRGMLGKPRGRLITLAEESGVSYQNLKLGGPPVDNVAIDEEGTITLVRLVSMCALLGLGLAFCCFRSVSTTIIVFFVGGISAVTSIAFVGWFGCSIDAILMSMPSLVYVLGISGAVHIINYYREAVEEHGHEGAPEKAVKHGWKPALLCNITTAIGLVSLCTSELNPIRKFGLFSALAVMSTVILLFSYLPAALQIWPQKPRSPAQRRRDEEPWYEKYLSRFWETIGGGIIRHHYVVAGCCILVIAVAGYGVTRINTSVNLLKMFDSKAKILQDYAWLEEHLGKLVPMEIVVKVDPSAMRAPVAAQAEKQTKDSEELFRLSFLERMEMADRVQRVVEQEFGESGTGVAGRSLSAITFAPPMPQAKGDNFTFARRGGTNARLEAHREEFLKSEYLRLDKTDNSELWRISVRVGALQDVDYGVFINDLKCAVEPVISAQRERDTILRALVKHLDGKRHVGAKVLLVGAPLGPSKKSAAAKPDAEGQPVAAVDQDGKRIVDQTKIFANALAELLTIARLRLDWHDPDSEPVPEDWSERIAQYDCVVLVENWDCYNLRTIESNAKLFVDCRDHMFDPRAPLAPSAVVAPNAAFAAVPAAAIPAAEAVANHGVTAVYTGVVPIVYKAQRTLLNSLIQSTFWSFITITPLMILVSRNIGGGLVAMLPNVLPVLVIFGSMGWMNIAVDIGSMMTASIALGVAVDDTIHYLSWYRQELDACGDRHKAILSTYKKCATPTLQAAVISGLGLSIFAFSTFTPTQRFGYLMLSILWAGVVAELIFFPALLAGPLGRVFKPSKKRAAPNTPAPAVEPASPADSSRIDDAERRSDSAEQLGGPHKTKQDAPHLSEAPASLVVARLAACPLHVQNGIRERCGTFTRRTSGLSVRALNAIRSSCRSRIESSRKHARCMPTRPRRLSAGKCGAERKTSARRARGSRTWRKLALPGTASWHYQSNPNEAVASPCRQTERKPTCERAALRPRWWPMNLDALCYFFAGTILPSLLVSFLAGFAVRRFAIVWGLVDRPNARKVHERPTPLGGGLAIWIGVLLPFAAGEALLWLVNTGRLSAELVPLFARDHLPGLAAQSMSLWVLLLAGTLLVILGLIDDRRGLDWRLRLAVQFGVAAACVISQGWRLTAFVNLPLLTGLLSAVWIVGLINSFNMLDNMDGLSAGVAALTATTLAAVLLLSPDPTTNRPQLFVAGLLLVLAGSLVGFLFHNRPPARLFMGDAGSYFIGFVIAVSTLLATYAGYKSGTRHAILAPVLVMAVPLYDMLSVIWIRLREGRSPFQADKCHFSHRLVELGLTKTQAVLTIYLTTATCGLGALLLHRVDMIGACIIVLLVLCVLALIAILESTARRKLRE